jgi:hypothetical protein
MTLAPTVERRARHRLEAACNALIRLSDTLTFRCMLRNISLDAAQIVCDARYALLVQSGPGSRSRNMEISIALPVDGTVRSFTAFCSARYCEPFEGDHMVLGLQFVDIDLPARGLLRDFLALHGGQA